MLKLDGDTGEVLWSQHYQGAEGLDEAALAVCTDSSGDVYFTGRAATAGQGIQMLTMKLDRSTGAVIWNDFYGLEAAQDDIGWDITIGSAGNPVVCGIGLHADGSASCVTRALNPQTGSEVWESLQPYASADLATANGWLAVMDNGDVATCHRGYGANGYDVLMGLHAAGDGTLVWSTRYDGPTHGGDNPHDMIRDAGGDILVCGVQDAAWNYDYMLLKFRGNDGSLAWTAPAYDGPPGWYDVADCIAVAPTGTIVVTGLSDGSDTGWDIATVGYDPLTGAQAWVQRFDGPASESDEGRDMVITGSGDIYVTGYGYGNGTGKDHLTLAYRLPPPSGVTPRTPDGLLEAVYPNPFNPLTTISYSLEGSANVVMGVYSLDGSLVRTLLSGVRTGGRHTVRWDGRDRTGRQVPSGTYILRLQTGGGTTTAKMTLAK